MVRDAAPLHRMLVWGSLLLLSAPVRGDLVVIQKSNGFPGAQQDALGEQKVSVAGERLRVLDPARGWALYVDLGARTVREVDAGAKTYTERSLDELDRLREERAAARARKAELFKQQREAARKQGNETLVKELEEEFAREGLSLGPPEANVDRPPVDAAQRTRSLVVDGRRVDVAVERVTIRENRGTRPVLDMWVAESLHGRTDLLKFWRAVGTFSNEVTDTLSLVKGFPLEIEANVDTGTFAKTFRAKVLEVRAEDLDPLELTIPTGFKKRTTAGGADLKVPCEVCGIELGEEQAKVVNLARQKPRYACAKHHLELLKKALSAAGPAKGGGN